MAAFHALTVAAVEPLTDDAVALTFAVPDELTETFRFTPGQHLTLRRVVDGRELRRTYSLCTSAVAGPLQVAVKRLPDGEFSGWVHDVLRPGDAVEVLPPAGRFGPRPAPGAARHVAAIAAGSGITPVLSILTTLLEVEPASTATLVYGNRTTRDVMFLDELHDLKDRFPTRLTLLHVLSREEQGAPLLSGRIDRDRLQRLFATLLPPGDVDEWVLCGPFGLVTEARQTLYAAGVDPACVHVELFHAEGSAPPRAPRKDDTAVSQVTAVLGGRATTVPVTHAGQSVLDAVLAVRADAPYACKGGVCGTCRARVVEGSVEMDVNYALEPDELAAGVVLTCQSHPTSDTVRLEFG